MRGDTLLGEGEEENPTKTGTSLLPLVARRRARFWGNFANIVFTPLPVGFLLALLFPSTLSPLSIFLVAAWDKYRG